MKMFSRYTSRLAGLLSDFDWKNVGLLASDLRTAWADRKQVFLCGNGGSAATAVHFAGDLIYGVSPVDGKGIRARALCANTSVMTCLSNDLSYNDLFSYQLSNMADPGDLLVVFSGSGNSPNILEAIKKAEELNLKSYGLLGFDGGRALNLVDVPIHFKVDDMQIAEDCHLIVTHMVMRMLKEDPVSFGRE